MATFYNQATLSYNGNLINSNITSGRILDTLSAAKTAVIPEYSNGRSITYIISLVNSGSTAFTDVTMTDNLGEYAFGEGSLVPLTYIENSLRYIVNGELSSGLTVTSQAPLTVTGINIPARGNTVLIYEADVNSYAPREAGSTITNTASFTGGGIGTPITAEETVRVQESPILSITKALNPSVVSENSTVTYTFTIQNTGNKATVATDNLFITDTFTPALSNISVTLNGAPFDRYSYDEATGVFTTDTSVIAVPAATYSQNPYSGIWTVNPGTAVLTVTGTI